MASLSIGPQFGHDINLIIAIVAQHIQYKNTNRLPIITTRILLLL
jgi:hypothetical protein